MLNRAKLMRELQGVADQLFVDHAQENTQAQKLFAQMAADPTFQYKINEIRTQSPWPLPSWHGKLNDIISLNPTISKYTALSVDGSQIYPDRHQGTACYLINIGSVVLHYGMRTNSPVVFDSIPYVFAGNNAHIENIQPMEVVNGKRQELELQAGLELSRNIKSAHPEFVEGLGALLFDGSLIFWHLEAKNPNLKTHFLDTYLVLLFELYKDKIPFAGYISLPKSKELVNLIKIYAAQFDLKLAEQLKDFDHVVDAAVIYSFLKPNTRSIVFKNHANVSEQYPDAVHPHFFYMHVGNEIGRVEIPAWIAQDEHMVNTIASIIIDQCSKGRGYPVVLAEAHEQAVVKGPDREFFYQLLHKFGFEQKQRFNLSQKVIKKRGIGI